MIQDPNAGNCRCRPPAAGRGAEGNGTIGLPSDIFRYVLRTSAVHQLFLILLTVAVFLIEVVPLELQRRIVNDVVKHRPYRQVIILCTAYAGCAFVHGATKLALNTYRAWVGERATRDLRRLILGLIEVDLIRHPSAPRDPEAHGIEIAMVVAEVEPIGGFVAA